MEAELIQLKTDLKATQRKLNLLCSWIQLKFGNDPTLPASLNKTFDDQSHDEISLKSEKADDSTLPEIRLVNWESIIAPSEEILQENPQQSHSLDCHVCGKTFFSARLLKFHETEHCFVQVQRLSSPSRRKDPLIPRNVEEYDENSSQYDESDSNNPASDPEDHEFLPELNSDTENEDENKDNYDPVEIGESITNEGVIGPPRTLPCTGCDELFTDTNSLLVHKYSVHQESNHGRRKRRLYPCHICGKSFLGTEHRIKHIKEDHADILNFKGKSKIMNKFGKMDRTITCPICDCSLRSRVVARKHVKREHADEVTSEVLASLEYPVPYCEECKIRFKQRGYYTTHLRLQHPQVYMEMRESGEIISKNRRRMAELGKEKSRGTPALLISCPLCSFEDKSLRQVRIHLQTFHPSDATPELLDSFIAPVVCEVCDKIYKERYYYYQHLRRCHVKKYDEKVASGEITKRCGRARRHLARNQENLSTGLEDEDKFLSKASDTHSDASLPCPLCDARFKSKRNIQIHLENFHPTEEIAEILEKFKEPNICTPCNRTFEHRAKYNAHLRNSHPQIYAEKIANGEIFPRPSRKRSTTKTNRNDVQKGLLTEDANCSLTLADYSIKFVVDTFEPNAMTSSTNSNYFNAIETHPTSSSEVFHDDVRCHENRCRKSTSEEWCRNQNKIKRFRGEAYIGFQTVNSSEGISKKLLQSQTRKARTMGKTCTSKKCERSLVFKCRQVDEGVRVKLFENFWKSMDLGHRINYVCSLVDYIDTKTKTTCNPNYSRRLKTLCYHLNLEKNTRIRVCKKMFLSTLSIGEFQVRQWVKRNFREILTPNTTKM